MNSEDSLGLSVPDVALHAEAEPRISGKLFPTSGVALVRYDDAAYFIQLSAHSYKEVVHLLTPAELDRIHMHNLHTEPSTELSAQDIGAPPFEHLIRMLGYEEELARSLMDIDMLLNAMEQTSVEFRYAASCGIEDLLRDFSEARPVIAQKLNSFIPPEDYMLDTVEIHNGFEAYKEMMELDETDFSESDEQTGFRPPRASFAESFPQLHTLIMEAGFHWEKTARIPNIQRVTRAQIQERHDSITLTAISNMTRRALKMRDTLLACLTDLRNPDIDGLKKWKEGYFEKRELANAKGEVVLWTQRRTLGYDRERFVNADTRIPGILEIYDSAIVLIAEAQRLLPSIEEVLGEIEGSNLVA